MLPNPSSNQYQNQGEKQGANQDASSLLHNGRERFSRKQSRGQSTRVCRSFITKVLLPTNAEEGKTSQLYLGLVDRPVRALLRSEATEMLAEGEYLYYSRPFGVGPWQVAPRIHLHAMGEAESIRISCRPFSHSAQPMLLHNGNNLGYAYGLDVRFLALIDGIEARGMLWLESVVLSQIWAKPLASLLMIELQKRLQYRFQHGLQKDFQRWLSDGKIAAASSEPSP